MKTEKLLIKQIVLECVQAQRMLVVEVPEGLRDHALLRRIVDEGDRDYGPFGFESLDNTGYREPVRLQVLGLADSEADIPCREDCL